jgi:hypothetical protein
MHNFYKYVRLCQGVKDRGILLLEEKIPDYIKDPNKDYYQSIFYYTDGHYEQFKKTGSIKGIKDVLTNKLVFDFDHKEDPDFARQEARSVIYRLTKLGVKENNIQIYYSGNKGFNVVVELDRWISPLEAQSAATRLTPDLKLDTSLYDHSQLLRIAGTRHPKSKLFKIPLTTKQFFNDSLSDIQNLATSLDNIKDEFDWGTDSIPGEYFIPREIKEEKKQEYTVSLQDKPKHWKNCKWSLLQGNFKSGERHEALLILAATCRGLGYDKETVYYLCKSSLKKQAKLTGQEEFSTDELWTNIIEESVFNDGWQGGQYSCKSDPWLQRYCKSLGEHSCKDKDEEPNSLTPSGMFERFVDYAENFDKNIIKTGLRELDDNVFLPTSTLVGLLGNPGAGKTSKAINYLLHTSLNDIPSMFFSLDMGIPLVYGKLIQKETKTSFKDALALYRSNKEQREKLSDVINDKYRNVGFCFRSGLTVSDMKKIIQDHEEKVAKKVKLVVVDYLECLAGPFSDSTANTGFIANQLKDLANELGICILLLLQTQKHSTPDVSDPLLSLKNVKGSSVIEQNCSVILTMWREGYNPKTVDDDRYVSFAVVKNRFGSLWKGDFHWSGMTGDIRSLTEEQKLLLEDFRERKLEMKLKELKAESDWH